LEGSVGLCVHPPRLARSTDREQLAPEPRRGSEMRVEPAERDRLAPRRWKAHESVVIPARHPHMQAPATRVGLRRYA